MDTSGVIGFSAGGHAVARFITEPSLTYSSHDSADELPARVDFAVLMYPVIATTGAQAHAGSAHQLLTSGVSAATLEDHSPDRHVSPGTPPTLLVHAADDDVVPVANSLNLAARLDWRIHERRRTCGVFRRGHEP
ncbi:MAG TPA: hypothetical protein VFO82_05130 [Steroidobacteraceae bacterium]|nr:hypothetical protein [Steroidobacteraceae bacterium]